MHDLRNPHHPEPGLHAAQLGVLVHRAAAVVTLTPGAAREIARRWGRVAEVLPHPHVVDAATMARPRPPHDGFVVGLHAKSLRSNMDVPGVAAPLAAAVRELPDARLRIDLHHEVSEPGGHHHAPDVVAGLRALAAAHAEVELHEHDYFTDAELWDYLLGLDVSVLPYRFGTHSGWLEACHDLGTAVIAPTCGFYAEQQPCVSYRHDEDGLDAGSLVAAVRRVHAERPAPRASVAEPRGGAARAGRRAPRAVRAAARVSALRVGLVAASRFPVAEPFAGGLEAHVWALADGLRRRGHAVTLFAGPGSDPRLGVELLDLRRPRLSAAARADVSMTAADWLDEHHAYLQLMIRLAGPRGAELRRDPQPQPAPPADRHGGDGRHPDRDDAAHAADALAGVRDPGRRRLPRHLRRGERAHRAGRGRISCRTRT